MPHCERCAGRPTANAAGLGSFHSLRSSMNTSRNLCFRPRVPEAHHGLGSHALPPGQASGKCSSPRCGHKILPLQLLSA